jgi:DNA-binding NarL/FixJ family response regulator
MPPRQWIKEGLVLVAEGLNSRPLIRVAATRRLRILVVEDHEVVRNGLRWLLTRVPWVDRCVVAGNVEDALMLARAVPFDLALVDVDLGLGACERLGTVPGLRVALLTSRWDLVPARTARSAGAVGVIEQELDAHSLLKAVRNLASGGVHEVEPAEGGPRFIPREREILRHVGAGLTNAEIGRTMFLAPGTIKHHMLGLYEKLGAPNRAAAVHAARRLGILADHQELPPAPEPCAPLRVLIADSRDVRRAGALLALHGRPWVEACRGARTADDALVAAQDLRPDVIVVGDAELGRMLDARGLVTLLVNDQDDVADAVLRTCHGTPEPAPDPVSPRERDVLSALASGATNPAIARELGLSPNTVKQHASSIFRKLGVRNRAEAVRRADELGLLAA